MNNGLGMTWFWEKSAAVGFLCAKKKPMRKHEIIYVFYENVPLYDISSHKHKFSNLREPHKETTVYGDLGIKTDRIKYDPPLPTSILQFKNERGKHKTQKPTIMMDWILKYYSKEGDTVLDPTMDSGSMGASWKSMNREFIGIEMDEDIYKVACDRLT